MSRTLCAMMLALILASCGGGYQAPPRNLDDACSIAKQRPKYMKAFKATQRKWGVPVSVQMATIYQESKYRGDDRTPFRYVLGVIPMGRDSSAYGYSQALDATWDWYRRDTGNRNAKRDNFTDAVDFMGWYMDQSTQKLAIAKADARAQYLADHDGHSGYARRSYKRKAWLMRVSSEVAARAKMYEEQLVACAK